METQNNPPDAAPSPAQSTAVAPPLPSRRKVDRRTRAARHLKMVETCLFEEIGPRSRMSHSRRALVADAASLIVRAEELQAAMARGEAVDPDILVRLSGAKMRVFDALGLTGEGLERRKAAEAEAERKRLLDVHYPGRKWD